jgi:hypothetical protein
MSQTSLQKILPNMTAASIAMMTMSRMTMTKIYVMFLKMTIQRMTMKLTTNAAKIYVMFLLLKNQTASLRLEALTNPAPRLEAQQSILIVLMRSRAARQSLPAGWRPTCCPRPGRRCRRTSTASRRWGWVGTHYARLTAFGLALQLVCPRRSRLAAARRRAKQTKPNVSQ